jgi:ribosomal-protein-alanine N-acetyltransferase
MLTSQKIDLLSEESHNNYRISPLKSRDVELICLFTNRYLSVSYSIGFFLQFLYKQGTLCLHLMSLSNPDKVLGVISGRLEYNKIGHIYTLAVEPEFRRIGVGTRLLNEFEKQMQNIAQSTQGELNSLSLEVKQSDYDAIEFYKKMGFLSFDLPLKGYYNSIIDCIQMTKSLT